MFTPEEDKPKGPPWSSSATRLWQERFGGRADVLGKELRLNSRVFTIIGVLPKAAEFPSKRALLGPDAGRPQRQRLVFVRRHRAVEAGRHDRTGQPGHRARASADLRFTRQGKGRDAVRARLADAVHARLRHDCLDARRRGVAAADRRLRQRRGGDAGARPRPPPRNGHPPRRRRQPRAPAAAIAGRERDPLRHRRGARLARRPMGDPALDRRAARSGAGLGAVHARCAHGDVHARHVDG